MVYFILLMWIAIIPGVILLKRVYKLDAVEKESKQLIRKILFWSIIAVFAAIIIELIAEEVLGVFFEEGTIEYLLVDNFLCVALVEEICKYLAAKKPTWQNPEFDYKFDAVVYCVSAAVGFAVLENIFYCLDGGISVALMRAFLAVPAHVIFGIIMGYFYGNAKYEFVHGNKRAYKRNVRLAILVPTLLHGFDDFCLSYEDDYVVLIYFVYVVVAYTIAFKKQKKMALEDSRI